MQQLSIVLACLIVTYGNGFTFNAINKPYTQIVQKGNGASRVTVSRMSQDTTEDSVANDAVEDDEPMDEATRIMRAKMKKVQQLKSQEVFIQKSTGKHQCTTCDWEFDETKGDAYMIGGMVQPGTAFVELPSNWRCPTVSIYKCNIYLPSP